MKCATLCLLILAAAPAAAQEVPEQPTPPTPPQRPLTWSFRFPTELGFSTGFDNAPGDVTVSRIGAELGVGIPIATMAQLDLGFDYEYSRYEFSNATGFVGGVPSPWADVHRESLRARFSQQHDLRTSWFVGGAFGLSAEEGADLDDSMYGSLYGGAAYAVSEKLTLGAALGAMTRIEDDPWIVFIPVVDWKINEQWRLNNADKLGMTLFYTPHQQWTFSLGAWYELRDFRLDDLGPVPGGVVREENVPAVVGVTFRPTPSMTIDVGAGAKFFGSYQLDNSAGNTIVEVDADPAPFLSFKVSIKF